MFILATALVLPVVLLHVYFLVLEMFLWTKPLGRKVFRQSAERRNNRRCWSPTRASTKAFSLQVWCTGVTTGSREFQLFFLGCVIVAGVYGAATVSRRILFVPAVPAVPALLAMAALLAAA